jgi:sulfur-oxidizing protein SoxA
MPKWSDDLGQPVNFELQVNYCRTERMQAAPYKFDDDDQRAMVTFIRHQSIGEPVTIDLEAGDMQSWWERGKEAYYTRMG